MLGLLSLIAPKSFRKPRRAELDARAPPSCAQQGSSIFASKSISDQRAPRTSPDRHAVGIANSNARADEPGRARNTDHERRQLLPWQRWMVLRPLVLLMLARRFSRCPRQPGCLRPQPTGGRPSQNRLNSAAQPAPSLSCCPRSKRASNDKRGVDVRDKASAKTGLNASQACWSIGRRAWRSSGRFVRLDVGRCTLIERHAPRAPALPHLAVAASARRWVGTFESCFPCFQCLLPGLSQMTV